MHNFSSTVFGALDIAQAKALELKNTELTPHHLLLRLIINKGTYSSKVLREHIERIEEF